MADELAADTPMVSLILEDGTGKANANTYATLEYADAYHRSLGRASWAELDGDTRRSRLVIATRYIDGSYPWKGARRYRDQRLAFPRTGVVDMDKFPVEGIPESLVMAVCEAAFIAVTDEALFLTKDANGQVKREAVENAVEVEYYQREGSSEYVSVYTVLDSLLRGLYRTAGTRQSVNTRARWVC